MRSVYVDHSATSFPKAPGVSDAIKDYLDKQGYNVNRGGYAGAYDVGMAILDTRQALADLLHTPSARNVVFTPGVTLSLNMLLWGFCKEGDHVLTTSMEHNAVMRPLHALSKRGVAYDAVVFPRRADGIPDAAALIPWIKKNTKVVVMTHASSVDGTEVRR